MEDEVLRAWLLSDVLNFTRYFFKEQYRRKFVVGEHHRIICDALNRVIAGDCRRLIINISPRYGKTELAVKNFMAYGLAVNPAAKFIHLSYSGDLALDNSVSVKDIINLPEYQRIFPDTRVKKGSDTKARWDTSRTGGVYATSTLGQITGFGAGLVEDEEAADEGGFGGAIIIDDPIKPQDALSDNLRDSVNLRFETTIRSRTNSRRTPIIIIMQRLHEEDLCGYLMELEPEEWEVISLPCIKNDGTPLWPFKHSIEELMKINASNSYVFETQYMQNPKPLEGLMYLPFRTYDILPVGGFQKRVNYTDTADTGADYHCSICYIETKDANYIIDVLYSQRSMEFTEVAQAKMLQKNNITLCFVEANNGGRGFRRNVERISREIGNNRTRFVDFTQHKNKAARIFTRSAEVNNLVLMPEDWERRWPEFARDILKYRKEGKNEHDDAPDALTGTVERRGGIPLKSSEIFSRFR